MTSGSKSTLTLFQSFPPPSILLVIAAALLLGSTGAPAAVIQYEMSGVMNDTAATPSIEPGASWQVTASYSGDLTDPGQAGYAFVTYQLLNYTFTVGSAISLTITPTGAGFQQQTTTLGIGRYLRYTGSDYVPDNYLEFKATNYVSLGGGHGEPIIPVFTLDGWKLYYSFVDLEGPADQLWGMDHRLADSLDYGLVDFPTRTFVITFENDRATQFVSVTGTVDQYKAVVVPLPATGLPFLSTLAGVGLARPRRSHVHRQRDG
jgi:hypothetical protein